MLKRFEAAADSVGVHEWHMAGDDDQCARAPIYELVLYGADGRRKQTVELAIGNDAEAIARVRGLHYANAAEVYRDGCLLERVAGTLLVPRP